MPTTLPRLLRHPPDPAMRRRPRARILPLAMLLCATAGANAASPMDAQGLWLSSDKAAVIRFAPCADAATALCGQIVWDKDAGTPADACGTVIARLSQYSDDAWRKGWVLDPRTSKHYKGVLRVQGDVLSLRAFVGVEVLGETEQMARVQSVPSGCKPAPASAAAS